MSDPKIHTRCSTKLSTMISIYDNVASVNIVFERRATLSTIHAKGTTSSDPADAGPPSPEPLPLVAGEGFWKITQRKAFPSKRSLRFRGRWISAITLAFLPKDGRGRFL